MALTNTNSLLPPKPFQTQQSFSHSSKPKFSSIPISNISIYSISVVRSPESSKTPIIPLETANSTQKLSQTLQESPSITRVPRSEKARFGPTNPRCVPDDCFRRRARNLDDDDEELMEEWMMMKLKGSSVEASFPLFGSLTIHRFLFPEVVVYLRGWVCGGKEAARGVSGGKITGELWPPPTTAATYGRSSGHIVKRYCRNSGNHYKSPIRLLELLKIGVDLDVVCDDDFGSGLFMKKRF
ncbi:hypothetical protein LguiA_024621 [Lonicera macranthoides]